jgi:hypothetical protein
VHVAFQPEDELNGLEDMPVKHLGFRGGYVKIDGEATFKVFSFHIHASDIREGSKDRNISSVKELLICNNWHCNDTLRL